MEDLEGPESLLLEGCSCLHEQALSLKWLQIAVAVAVAVAVAAAAAVAVAAVVVAAAVAVAAVVVDCCGQTGIFEGIFPRISY